MLVKKVVYVDKDDVLCDFSGGHKKASEKNTRFH